MGCLVNSRATHMQPSNHSPLVLKPRGPFRRPARKLEEFLAIAPSVSVSGSAAAVRCGGSRTPCIIGRIELYGLGSNSLFVAF